jgi:hypothetical protein
MASPAQIAANRQNALKSTGPKTEEGKARARGNALKHGFTARRIVPVLPHEDPRALDERIATWTEDWQPQCAGETELVCRAAQLSWLLDRAERAETAHLTHRVREAARRGGQLDPDRFEEIDSLGRKLFYDTQPKSLERGIGSQPPPWPDQPTVFVRRLEQTQEGCQWLLDRWLEFRNLIHRRAAWQPSDFYRFLRLQGKSGIEAVYDPTLNALFQAWDLIWAGAGKACWKLCRQQAHRRDPAHNGSMAWRQIAEAPADVQKAWELLHGIVSAYSSRLEVQIKEFTAIAELEEAKLADRAVFDSSAVLDRHRRYQASLGRELLRTVDTLRKLQNNASDRTKGASRPHCEDRGCAAGSAQETETTSPDAEQPEPACSRGCSSNEADDLLMQADLEMEDMAIGEVDSPEKRSQCTSPRGLDQMPRIRPDQAAAGSSGRGF